MKINCQVWTRADLIILVILILAVPGFSPAKEEADLAPSRLRCEYKENPEGIDVAQPRLGWIVTSSRRARVQTAYRVLAASTRENLDQDRGDLWDSGRVESDETVQIVYQGKALQSRQPCFWKVMVWDNDGRPSGWSEPATWSMGLLRPGDWRAEWIGQDPNPGEVHLMELHVPYPLNYPLNLSVPGSYALHLALRGGAAKMYLPCPFLRTEFQVQGPVRRAVVYATALGLYELHLNGERVGADFFTPGWSDYRRRLYYQAYDVTGLIQPGTNALGAILADGWYAGNVNMHGQRFYGSRVRLRAQLHLEYEDGTEQTVMTDGSWRTARGPIQEADIQAGESYDARLELPGWDRPGFDDREWRSVDVGSGLDVVLQAYPGLPVRRIMEIKPIGLTEPRPGVWVFNLGQNFAGRVRLKVQGQAGDRVVLRFGEMLNPDGTVYTSNLRSARATDTYVLKGGAEEVWEPRFTYHGFQYVEVTGYPGTPDLDAITGIALHNDLPLTGSFECSHPLVNKLYSNIVWGQRSNYFEVPTDCPQRDERLGWTGDAQVFIRTAAYNMDVAAFFTKWLNELADGQHEDGSYPVVAPAVLGGAAAGWSDAGVICPYTIYRVYGDTRLLEQHYAAMTRYLDFLEQRSPGYVSPPLGTYGDWLNIQAPTPLGLIATAYFARDARLMAEIARALGRDRDAARWQDLFEKIRAAFTGQFVAGDGRIQGDTQTAYALALEFELLPESVRAQSADMLVARIQDRDGLLSTGFLGLNALLPALTKIGRNDVACQLLTNRRYPSWGYSIDQGATTVWERWNSYTVEGGFASISMNSFNHYAYGSVGEWMFSTMAGIESDGPGFKKLLIHPRPGGDVTWVRAGYDSIRGKIESSWRTAGEDFRLDLTLPANTTATVSIPARTPEDVIESGRPAAAAPGVRLLALEPGTAVFELGSGSYQFESKRAVNRLEESAP